MELNMNSCLAETGIELPLICRQSTITLYCMLQTIRARWLFFLTHSSFVLTQLRNYISQDNTANSTPFKTIKCQPCGANGARARGFSWRLDCRLGKHMTHTVPSTQTYTAACMYASRATTTPKQIKTFSVYALRKHSRTTNKAHTYIHTKPTGSRF